MNAKDILLIPLMAILLWNKHPDCDRYKTAAVTGRVLGLVVMLPIIRGKMKDA